jgi:hypothetical protein
MLSRHITNKMTKQIANTAAVAKLVASLGLLVGCHEVPEAGAYAHLPRREFLDQSFVRD